MKHVKLFEQFVNEKVRPVRGTPFHIYWGGREIEGQCKWVVDVNENNYDVLDAMLQDVDQLWCSKEEAIEAAQGWWAENKKEWSKKIQENFATDNPELERIRMFSGTVQDLDDWLRSKIGETNPYKDTIMVNGPHRGQKDKSLPYQDFQNGQSDLVKNRYYERSDS